MDLPGPELFHGHAVGSAHENPCQWILQVPLGIVNPRKAHAFRGFVIVQCDSGT